MATRNQTEWQDAACMERAAQKSDSRPRCCYTIAGLNGTAARGGSFCLSRHINTELIKTAELIEFL